MSKEVSEKALCLIFGTDPIEEVSEKALCLIFGTDPIEAFLTREALGEIARVTVANLHAAATGGAFLEGTVL